MNDFLRHFGKIGFAAKVSTGRGEAVACFFRVLEHLLLNQVGGMGYLFHPGFEVEVLLFDWQWVGYQDMYAIVAQFQPATSCFSEQEKKSRRRNRGTWVLKRMTRHPAHNHAWNLWDRKNVSNFNQSKVRWKDISSNLKTFRNAPSFSSCCLN